MYEKTVPLSCLADGFHLRDIPICIHVDAHRMLRRRALQCFVNLLKKTFAAKTVLFFYFVQASVAPNQQYLQHKSQACTLNLPEYCQGALRILLAKVDISKYGPDSFDRHHKVLIAQRDILEGEELH